MTGLPLSYQRGDPLRTLVAGIGSVQGDDRIGWEVIQGLRARLRNGVELRIASVPLDLLDWMQRDMVLHIVDACDGLGMPGQRVRWEWREWPARDGVEETFRLRGTGTHDYGLMEVLQLAERLRLLPQTITIHAVQGEQFTTSESLSPAVAACLPDVIEVIAGELSDARTIIGQVAADAG